MKTIPTLSFSLILIFLLIGILSCKVECEETESEPFNVRVKPTVNLVENYGTPEVKPYGGADVKITVLKYHCDGSYGGVGNEYEGVTDANGNVHPPVTWEFHMNNTLELINVNVFVWGSHAVEKEYSYEFMSQQNGYFQPDFLINVEDL